jgi:hypothetical protein
LRVGLIPPHSAAAAALPLLLEQALSCPSRPRKRKKHKGFVQANARQLLHIINIVAFRIEKI